MTSQEKILFIADIVFAVFATWFLFPQCKLRLWPRLAYVGIVYGINIQFFIRDNSKWLSSHGHYYSPLIVWIFLAVFYGLRAQNKNSKENLAVSVRWTMLFISSHNVWCASLSSLDLGAVVLVESDHFLQPMSNRYGSLAKNADLVTNSYGSDDEKMCSQGNKWIDNFHGQKRVSAIAPAPRKRYALRHGRHGCGGVD